MTQLIPFIILLMISSAPTAKAQQDPKLAKQYIEEILQQPEFETTREVHRWRYIGELEVEPQSDELSTLWVRFIAQLFELLLWILLGVGIGILIYYIWRWQPTLPTSTQTTQPSTPQRLVPQTTALPDDIPEQAWQLWQRGEHQAALSLLYRATLIQLSQQQQLAIAQGATEHDCLELVQTNFTGELAHYFALLTRHWQNSAYAQRQPNDAEVEALCQQWSHYFNHA